MDALEDDALGVLAEELEDVLDLGLVREAPEADAVLPSPRSDDVLREESGDGGERRHPRGLNGAARVAARPRLVQLHRTVQHLHQATKRDVI